MLAQVPATPTALADPNGYQAALRAYAAQTGHDGFANRLAPQTTMPTASTDEWVRRTVVAPIMNASTLTIIEPEQEAAFIHAIYGAYQYNQPIPYKPVYS